MTAGLTRRALPALLSLVLAPLAFSTVLVEVPASLDNTLFETAAGDLSNGAGQYLFAGNTAPLRAGATRRGLLSFDVASILPGGVTINSVALTLYMSRSISGAQDISLHRLTQEWGEGSSDASGQEGGGATATPGDATWLHTFNPGSTWTNEGGDFSAIPSATTPVAGTGSYLWTGAGLVGDVQDMLDDPDNNFGWILVGNESALTTAKRFNSRENGLNPPVLTIEYTPIPEPAIPASLALGLLVALRPRRRR